MATGKWLRHRNAHHQIHHSQAFHQYDRNFGSALAIWDWMGRSLYLTHGREPLRFGLPVEVQNHRNSVWSVLVSPLRAALERLVAPLRAGPAQPR